ncbi:MAG: type II secretion system F family protein [Planctomycetaceae bacterium]
MAALGRIPDAALAALLHRLSIAVAAGVDLRRAWASEASRTPARWRPAMARVAARLEAGDPLGESCADSGGAIPAVVAGMLAVGDRTGRLAEVLEETSRSISRSLALRRTLRAAVVGPAIRLAVAAVAIVVLIMVAGSARGIDGGPLDFLGLGLRGSRGAAVAAIAMAAVVAGALALITMGRRSWHRRSWAWTLGRRLPVVGPAAEAGEAAAWCRAASLAAHAGLGIGQMVDLASRAAPGFACDPGPVEQRLRSGSDLAATLAAVVGLPRVVTEAVAVGEATGTTAEALDRVADHLDEQAARGLAAGVQMLGFLAWAVVAGLVVTIVVGVVGGYARMVEDLARPR